MNFHRLIDDVAGEMTAGDPKPGFRARVLERATAESTATRARWPAPLFFAMAGAAVVILVAGLLVNVRGPQRGVEISGVIVADAGGSPVPTVAVSEPVVESARSRSDPGATPRVEAVPASVLEWRARAIPELTAVAPMTLGEIQPVWLSIAQLDVTPLGIAPIAIAPIGGEGGGRW